MECALLTPTGNGSTNETTWRLPTALPTQDMLAEALPEGVHEDGGRVDGFIYFQNVTREDQVRFELKLVDASNGTELGTPISVPFRVGRR